MKLSEILDHQKDEKHRGLTNNYNIESKMKNHINVILISLTVLISVVILTSTYKNRNRADDIINVTGLGKKDFVSDLIVWSGSFKRKSLDLKAAYKMLDQDRESILKYLISKGVDKNEVLFSSVDINKEFYDRYDDNGNRISEFSGYRLIQDVEIESKEVAKIENVSRRITELINLGLEFYSENPQYYYTKLSELKIEMISAATNDARIRAERIAENAEAEIDELRYAKMGVFQIISQNSNDNYSWGGTYNTSSKMKTATITMKLQFGLK